MEHFFALLRVAIGTQQVMDGPLDHAAWATLYRTSVQHGVTAVVFDVVKHLPKAEAPDTATAMQWFSAAAHVENTMRRMAATAEAFAAEMATRSVPVVVLKGMAFAQYYPNPLHRECGDLDCFMMGQKEEGDRIAVALGGKVEEAGYKHSHLQYKGLTIENHRFFTDFDNTRRGILTERLLGELVKEGQTYIGQSKLLFPSVHFNALLLLRHAQGHFMDEGIRMRHVLDWALLLKTKQDEVDWARMLPILEKIHTARFAGVMTAIAVRCLGIDVHDRGLAALAKQADNRMVDAVLADIMGEQPAIYVRGFWHKTKRIMRRFRRMWRFRSLAGETYLRMVWNAFAFSSYARREAPGLE